MEKINSSENNRRQTEAEKKVLMRDYSKFLATYSSRKLTLIEKDVLKGRYCKEYVQVASYADKLLGNIHHICTNDFSRLDGAIVWTDHGIKHSMRIIVYLSDIIKKGRIDVSPENKFTLLCAAWLHDSGMFFRHPDFSDNNIQRKYHGRIARSIIRQIASKNSWNDCLKKLGTQIAEICELHQSKTKFIEKITSIEINEYGNLLLLADAIDICKERISGKEIEIIKNMLPEVNIASNAEWWINECIKKLPTIEFQHGEKIVMKLKYEIDMFKIRETSELRRKEDVGAIDDEILKQYLCDYIKRYILKEHFSFIKSKRRFLLIDEVEIDFLPVDTDGEDMMMYKKYKELWIDHFIDYRLDTRNKSLLMKPLDAIRKAVSADDIYVFVFDQVRQRIRYLTIPTYFEINQSWKNGVAKEKLDKKRLEIENILHNQKIFIKFGIIGHVFYCGLKGFVEHIKQDPRRIYEKDDDILGLNSVMFYPIIKPDSDSTIDGELWAVIMVNRSEKIFRKEEVGVLETSIMNNGNNDAIISVLRDYTIAYT